MTQDNDMDTATVNDLIGQPNSVHFDVDFCCMTSCFWDVCCMVYILGQPQVSGEKVIRADIFSKKYQVSGPDVSGLKSEFGPDSFLSEIWGYPKMYTCCYFLSICLTECDVRYIILYILQYFIPTPIRYDIAKQTLALLACPITQCVMGVI